MSAELKLTRASRLVDLAWPYRIVLDGQDAVTIRNGATARLPLSPGTHTLQIRSLHIINRHIGLTSPTATFDVGEGETTEFACHPHSPTRALPQWLACLRGNRSDWIILERVATLE